MCTTSKIMDPLGVMKKHPKLADPLGLTKTAIGDPTGRWRRSYAADDRKAQAAKAASDRAGAFAAAQAGNGTVARSY